MKPIVIAMLFGLSPLLLLSQKHDYLWLMGYYNNPVSAGYGGTDIDFNTSPPGVYYHYRPMNIELQNASICDSTGNLMFYTNGCFINSHNDQLMENGNSLNSPSSVFDKNCTGPEEGLRMIQSAIALPSGAGNGQYFLFHTDGEFVLTPTYVYLYPKHLYYSYIDMSENGGVGKVISKNQVLMNDTILASCMTACKHQNGKDWWVLSMQEGTNQFYKFRTSGDNILAPVKQNIGEPISQEGNSGAGQAVFSPDGKTYIQVNCKDGIRIYDFNRQSGELSNFKRVDIIQNDTVKIFGVAVSPNSRYLYVSALIDLYQFDLQAPDIQASAIQVGHSGNYFDPFRENFYHSQLGPDCKIYITGTNGGRNFHVIHKPDLPGTACQLEQHGLILPTYRSFTIPNFPHYRLGSNMAICDSTISTSSFFPIIPKDLVWVLVYPNPASEKVKFEIDLKQHREISLSVFTPTGRLMKSIPLSNWQSEYEMHVSDWPTGIYFWQVKTATGQLLKAGKLIAQPD